MRRLAPIVLLALLAAGLCILRRQAQARARWQADVARLQRVHAALVRLGRENAGLPATPVVPADAAEIARIRAELDRLRPTLAKLHQELKQQLQMNAAIGPPKPLAPGMTPVGRLTNAGAATPDAAAQSFFWAVAQADPGAMASQLEFSDDALARAQALFASLSDATRAQLGSPERVMAIYLTSMYGRATGYQLVTGSYSPESADAGEWQVNLQTASGSLHDISFPVHRTDGVWREVVGVKWVDEAARYLR